MDPLKTSLVLLGIAVIYSFFAGLITRNYSQVDRLWSLLPPVYALIWLPLHAENPRYLLGLVLVVLWGARLTANFAVKGGYRFSLKRGFYGEDYRWEVLRRKIPARWAFELFNLFFISFYQLALVFWITLPLYFLGGVTGPLKGIDLFFLSLWGGLLVLETVADLQQLGYYKKRIDPAFGQDRRVQLGFNTFGLWKYSRHPNYVGEMGQWLVLSLYLQVSLGAFHWAGMGALLLILLFAGSTVMAEYITASKYPAYSLWKRATSPWIPVDLPLKKEARRSFMEDKF